MSRVTIKMTSGGKRQVSLSQSEVGRKKDRNASRHSYHQGSSAETFAVMRERSFVRPDSALFISLAQGGEQQQVRGRSKGAITRGKPAMEIYRPPTLRAPNGVEMGQRRPTGLNIHAKEFVSVSHSKSSGSVHHHMQQKKSPSPPKVHFSDDKENQTKVRPTSSILVPIKRSKSLGAADMMRPATSSELPLAAIGPFPNEVQSNIAKAINDPNALSARLLMEVVRHVISRVTESSKFSEPTARICIAIIEKEKGETFLETLLNLCQDFFQQRNKLLRFSVPASTLPQANTKWIAYMSFLNEMYTQLKRRHVQLMTRRTANCESSPGLILLSLLAQCCQVCLKEHTVNSLPEMECLFFVLTAIGKDLETELPHQMSRVMTAARDALMTQVRVPASKKTLLQLIEMNAARWHLPAPAVMYYYPSSGVGANN